MKYFTIAVSIAIIFFGLFGFSGKNATISAQSEQEKKEELERKIAEYETKIKELNAKANTLGNQISQFDAQISLTQLKIKQTQDQIDLLESRITQISISLDDLNSAYGSRVRETYKMSRLNDPSSIILSQDTLLSAANFMDYLKRAQEADKKLLTRLAKAQDGYKSQKEALMELNKKLEGQKRDLDNSKAAKTQLLNITKNDEKKYQSLLLSAKAEYDAIQAIIAGKGEESEVGRVSEGQKIATIIDGASCNSSGSHLHFIVAKNGVDESPFSYLKPGVDYENCSGPGSCSPADTFNPTGSWIWPLDGKITFTQGYGSTWFVRTYNWYPRHNGIDLTSKVSNTVKAVKNGTLYRGSFSGFNGCRLRYVRVKHDEGGISTYYLHVNY